MFVVNTTLRTASRSLSVNPALSTVAKAIPRVASKKTTTPFSVNTSLKPSGVKTPRSSNINEQQRVIIDSAIRSLSDPSRKITIGNALAGSGKTSTAVELAHELNDLGGDILYLVFAKRNAEEAKTKFPGNTKPMTAHGFAFGSKHPDVRQTMAAVYSGRLTGSLYGALRDLSRNPVMKPRFDRASDEFKLRGTRIISAIQGIIENYCQSADDEIGKQHLSAETLFHIQNKLMGEPDYEHLLSIARDVFTAMRDPEGDFPITHGFYLKLCSMYPPRISRKLIILDEAQDANPAMLKIIESQMQYGTSLMFVGDTNQRVYSFTGAVDAMAYMKNKYPDQVEVHPLTGSYRFGQPVADAGNAVLALMGYPHDGQGLSGRPTLVSDEGADCTGATVLYRANMPILADIMGRFRSMNYHIVGGTKELEDLLQGLSDLYIQNWSKHPELSVFESWAELVEFSETSAGSSIRSIVDYVSKQKGEVSEAMFALAGAEKDESKANVVLSTAHKSKGMQWPKVVLSTDMSKSFEVNEDGEYVLPDPDELALLYVAVTRAESELYTNGVFDAMLHCASHSEIDPVFYGRKGWALPDVQRAYERVDAAIKGSTAMPGDDTVERDDLDMQAEALDTDRPSMDVMADLFEDAD